MRVLITGATGFVGHHLRAECSAGGHEPLSLGEPGDPHASPGDLVCDLRDAEGLREVVRTARPDACIHLAGIAFVPRGWSDPELVLSVNTLGTLNLLEALRAEAPQARTVVVSSAEVYGREPRERPVAETDPLRPGNLYAVSKMAADLSALLYAKRYGMAVMTARPQNHIGPGQHRSFVVSSFAEQLALMAQGRQEKRMKVGNLDSKRDFSDVRDVARAYRLIMEKGHPGCAYNLAGGVHIPIRYILEVLREIAGVEPVVEVDPERFRPTDEPPLLAVDRAWQHVGWRTSIHLRDTLSDIYQDIYTRLQAA